MKMLYTGQEKDTDFVVALFDMYSALEITTLDDLFRSHRSFYDFVKSNKLAFLLPDRDLILFLAHRRVCAIRSLDQEYLYKNKKMHQKNFTTEVKEVVGNNKDVKILEVGSGRIPYSSMLLGVDGFNVSTMDDIYLSAKCLANFNVKSYRQLFDKTTKVGDFDIVVARRPCSAIKSIVTNCTTEQKPYFLRLCPCDLSSKNIEDWQPILRSIDGDVEFRNSYAYNLNNANFEHPKDVADIVALDTDIEFV